MASLRLELRAEFPDIHVIDANYSCRPARTIVADHHVSTVLPGVVSTAFGANALHVGPDSRTLPDAQPVDEVARAIAGLIEHPRAELYTRPELAKLAERYFAADDVATVEAGPPLSMPRR